MQKNKNQQSRREFLKNILRTTVFSGLISIGFIAIKKKDGTSQTTELCSQQRCGKCSRFVNCNFPTASSYRKLSNKTMINSTGKSGNPK